MGTTFIAVDPTLAWTQSYGSASPRARAREMARDAAFALAVLVCAAGAVGFLTIENLAPRYAQAAAARPAL
jgi:hypothetical protein